MGPEPTDQLRSQELRAMEGEVQPSWSLRLRCAKLMRPDNQGTARRDTQTAYLQSLPAKLSLAQWSFWWWILLKSTTTKKKKKKQKKKSSILQIATNGLDDEDRGETVHLKIVKAETKKWEIKNTITKI